ncbi:hypothetical protein KQR57_10615 [Bacillus inaquosorum]|nr:hypothetical protein [Bacillus inaquosorum]
MLYSAEGFKEASLRRTMERIASHHDALRMIFEKSRMDMLRELQARMKVNYTIWK